MMLLKPKTLAILMVIIFAAIWAANNTVLEDYVG